MRSKFLLSFFMLALIPFLTFGAAMHVKGSYLLLRQNNKQITSGLDSYLGNIESFINLASGNKAVNDLFESISGKSYPESLKACTEAVSLLREMEGCIRNIEFNGIYILKNNRIYTVYSKYGNPIPRNDVFSKKWYSEATGNPDKVKFIGTSMQFFGHGESEYIFSAAKALISPHSQKPYGLLLVDFDYSGLDKAINSADYFNFGGHQLYIINRDSSNISDSPPGSTIMYSSSINLLTSPADPEMLKIIGNSSSGTYLRNIKGMGDCILALDTPARAQWKVVYTIPVYKLIFNLMPLNSFWFKIAILCFLLILAFPFVIYWVMLKPINRLTSVITEYEKGSFPTKMNLDNPGGKAVPHTDSPGSPSSIDNLINKVYYNQLKQKEAELNSLQSKINPHFLYNTLESIRGAALYYGIDSIASMAKSLSLLFRYSINSNVLVSVKEEVENMGNYITIQNFRHDDKFEVIYNIPEKVYGYKILKLILQPIVENSIKHGLEMKLGKGTIKITCRDLGSIIKIEISDDGSGMAPEKIAELNRLLSDGSPVNDSGSGTGIGVQNVNSRIKLYFGEQYGIRFREAQTGTIAEIMLPVVE